MVISSRSFLAWKLKMPIIFLGTALVFFMVARIIRHRSTSQTSTSSDKYFPESIPQTGPVVVLATLKALNQHKRSLHGDRNVMAYFARADGVCPSCRTVFGSRLQLFGYLSDSQRSRCALFVLEHCARIPEVTLQKLDLEDRAARKSAYRLGRSHAVVQAPAKSASGRVIGRPAA